MALYPPLLLKSGKPSTAASGDTVDPAYIAASSYTLPQATATTLGGVKSPATTTATQLVKFTDAAGTLGPASAVEDSSGNIGIGITSPVCKLDVSGTVRPKTYTVATLPAASLGAGQRGQVTDALSTLAIALGAVVTGGGANYSTVTSDGTNWRQM